ncbi:2-oxoacid-dependent dioxygenase [Selaginella moellendorffii]|uniref:2-oxoacid-dependent dioxygenase n=1 Tax=Selaginella moellendorffii TaxID=88036 RepID=D8RK89_SELML|nr:2-oxoacid-dependent dioxygenase [Selaginella moellendorffii]
MPADFFLPSVSFREEGKPSSPSSLLSCHLCLAVCTSQNSLDTSWTVSVVQKRTSVCQVPSQLFSNQCPYKGCDKCYFYEYKLNLHLKRRHVKEEMVEHNSNDKFSDGSNPEHLVRGPGKGKMMLGHVKRSLSRSQLQSQVMVLNFYPACPEPDLVLGIAPHLDPGSITLLLQYHIEGLQVMHNDKWYSVKPILYSFVVNLGDQTQVSVSFTNVD